MLGVLLTLIVLFAGWRFVRARLTKVTEELQLLKAQLQALEQAGLAGGALRRDIDAAGAELRPGGVTSAPESSQRPTAEPIRATSPRGRVPEETDAPGTPAPELAVGRTPPGPAHEPDAPRTLQRSPHVPAAAESLETIIGSQWLLYVGIVAIVIGASYFVKLAFDNQWITETGRVVIGAAAGILLAYVGSRFVRVGYQLYGQILIGGGIAILYVSIYAAFAFYRLVAQPIAFALMGVVTMATTWLADRQRSQGLAVAAVGGGFATPFLLATGRDAQIALFTYDAILVGGTMYLARRREWAGLNLVSYAGTVLTFAAWAQTFYAPDKYLATEGFLTAFCGMFLYILYESRRSAKPPARVVRGILWSAPVLYYLASLEVLFAHPVALLLYVISLTVTGVIVARRFDSSPVRFACWAAVQAALFVWLVEHFQISWLTAGLATVTGTYALTLLGQLEVLVRQGRRFDDADVALLHASGLVAYAAAWAMIDTVRSAATAPVAFAFALWHVVLAGALAKLNRADALHFVGLAFTLAAIGIALQFDAAWLTVGWAAEGAAAMWLGLHERRRWLRAGGGLLLAMAVVRLVALQFSAPAVNQLVLFNQRAACGAFVVALLYGLARLYGRSPLPAILDPQPRIPSPELPAPSPPSRARAVLLVTANALTLLLLTSEITRYWQVREVFETSSALSRNARLTREVMLSTVWAAYATGLIMAGLRKQYAPIRYFAIVVFGVTILKVFMVDLAELDRLYRVLSIVGVGALLLVTSYLYQRSRARLVAADGDGA